MEYYRASNNGYITSCVEIGSCKLFLVVVNKIWDEKKFNIRTYDMRLIRKQMK